MEININETETTNSKKKMIALEMPESLYQKLRKEAFERELSISAIVRYIAEMYFLDEKEKGDNK